MGDRLRASTLSRYVTSQLGQLSLASLWGRLIHRCKITFLRFLTFFYFPNFLNVGKVQSGKQINKKHFQNNSNEIDL